MNRIIILIIALTFLNQCSLNENSRIWKDKEKKLEAQKNIKKVFLEDKKITTEFNQELKLDLSIIKFNNKIIDDKNNYGSQSYEGLINNIIKKITSKWKMKYKIILTGGYAKFFKKIIKRKTIVDQNITIKGISKVYKELI